MPSDFFSDDVCHCPQCRAQVIRLLEPIETSAGFFKIKEGIPVYPSSELSFLCDIEYATPKTVVGARVVDEDGRLTGQRIQFYGKLADEITKLAGGSQRLTVQIKNGTESQLELNIKDMK